MITVLTVASDDAHRAWMMSALAGRPDYHVISLVTLEEAIERSRLHPVDVIVADVAGGKPDPLMAGLQSEARGKFSVIALERQRISSLRPQDVRRPELPCEPEQLAEAVRIAVGRRRAITRNVMFRGRRSADQVSMELELDNDKSHISSTVDLLIDQSRRLTWMSYEESVRIRIAIEEALMNAVIHGNLEVRSELRECEGSVFERTIAERLADVAYNRRRVNLRMKGDQRSLRWVIRDEGPGFDVSKIPDPRDPERMALASGRGVLLMRAFMDEVNYNAAGNEVELVKINCSAMDQSGAAAATSEAEFAGVG
jgi:anti-sigma regulatory factor (Ser/Thr protein kinase)